MIDDLRELVALSAANRHIIYSPVLASQIPQSYAANAFNVFQWSSLNYEILRACALWDDAARDRASIPTAVRLIDEKSCSAIIEADLMTSGGSKYTAGHLGKLNRTIRIARRVKSAKFAKALYEFRNTTLAHTLVGSSTSAPRTMPKYGYERRLLRASIAIVEGLNNAVRDSSFAFDMAVEQSERNAEALWKGCTFAVLR